MPKLPDIRGLWRGGDFQQTITMSDNQFNVTAVTAALKEHWVGGEGEVFHSGKLYVNFHGGNMDGKTLQGYVVPQEDEIRWEQGSVWTLVHR